MSFLPVCVAGYGFSAGRSASILRPLSIKVKFRTEWDHCRQENCCVGVAMGERDVTCAAVFS